MNQNHPDNRPTSVTVRKKTIRCISVRSMILGRTLPRAFRSHMDGGPYQHNYCAVASATTTATPLGFECDGKLPFVLEILLVCTCSILPGPEPIYLLYILGCNLSPFTEVGVVKVKSQMNVEVQGFIYVWPTVVMWCLLA